MIDWYLMFNGVYYMYTLGKPCAKLQYTNLNDEMSDNILPELTSLCPYF